ncbi:MAG: DUF6544 family protein [Acidobacteriota bacterium]
MRWLFVALLTVHGLIHLMGVAKAYDLAELAELTQPVSKATGLVWVLAAALLIATAVLLVTGSRLWWAAGAAGIVVSQVVIAAAWGDARFGTIANVLIAAGVVCGFASIGPMSLRAEYEREIAARAEPAEAPPVITDADLAHLPPPVQRYVRLTGAVGQPRVHHVWVSWRGRIRGAADEPWMDFTAEQHNFLDEPARFFVMDATRGGLPVDVLHAYHHGAASMRVRLLSLVPLVSADGPDMTRAETVTLLNDLALLAPAGLINQAIQWEPLDDRSARARYTVGAHTVSAVLWFNDAGELVNFTSDDRMAQSAGGAAWTAMPWSTPVGEYRQFGPWRLVSRGAGTWRPPEGEYTYIEMEVADVRTNARPSR